MFKYGTLKTFFLGSQYMRIVVRQMSGLGNQLFQYAAGLYFAEKYHADLQIAIDPPLQAFSHGLPRPFQLSLFAITVPARPVRPLEKLMQSWNPKLKPAAYLLRTLLNVDFIEEPQPYRFCPDLPFRNTADKSYIRGYWQAAQYAEAVATRLRSDLVLRNAPSGRNQEVLQEIQNNSDAVSIHVRRGDYLLAKQGSLALPLSYYHAAVRTIRQKTSSPCFFVFSDDVEFARNNLPDDIRGVFVDHNSALTAYEDLRLMSACSHNIIANSSFSWWAAWLNRNPEKIVISPKFWFRKSESYYPDLFPHDWTLIDNL